jgi:hypothetical protein
MSELKTDFVSFTILLFALLNFVLVTYLWPLKMGGEKRSDWHDLYVFTTMPFF